MWKKSKGMRYGITKECAREYRHVWVLGEDKKVSRSVDK